MSTKEVAALLAKPVLNCKAVAASLLVLIFYRAAGVGFITLRREWQGGFSLTSGKFD